MRIKKTELLHLTVNKNKEDKVYSDVSEHCIAMSNSVTNMKATFSTAEND